MSGFDPSRTLAFGNGRDRFRTLCEALVMLWFMISAQLSAVVPHHPDRWFSHQDVPSYLVKQDEVYLQLPARVTVRPDGKLQDCAIEVPSGIADLDKYTCQIFKRRARFGPARIDNVPSYGVYRTVIRWIVTNQSIPPEKPQLADIDLVVERLPAGLKSPVSVAVLFEVSEDGSKSGCAANEASGPMVRNDPALVPVACDQIMRQYQATPPVDGARRPTISVQNALVTFWEAKSN
jgi:hypothetical protein